MGLQGSLVWAWHNEEAAVLSVDLLHGSPGTHDAVGRSVQEEMASFSENFQLHTIIKSSSVPFVFPACMTTSKRQNGETKMHTGILCVKGELEKKNQEVFVKTLC